MVATRELPGNPQNGDEPAGGDRGSLLWFVTQREGVHTHLAGGYVDSLPFSLAASS